MGRYQHSWAWVCLLVTTIGVVARAAPVGGVDCECGTVGNYILPEPLVEVAPASALTSLSPGGKYTVTASSNGGGMAQISVFRVGSSSPLLNNVSASSWGFSPDDDRFVVYAFESTVLYAHLYNLDSAHPETNITPPVDVSRSGLIGFSPHGRFAVAMSISSAAPNLFDLAVIGANTGTPLHQTQLSVYTPSVLPAELPDGQTELGAIRVGFGPGYGDRSFVYAWIDNNTQQKNWMMLKLDDSPVLLRSSDPSSYGFSWGFSPCGDRFAAVTANTDTSLKQAHLFSTLDQSQVGTVEYPISDDDYLSVDAVAHVAHHGFGGAETIAANTANGSCSGTAVVPVAAFSVGTKRMRGITIAFADSSTTARGTLTNWQWSFGDGTTSTSANPSHSYVATGDYTVALTVTNSFGETASTKQTLSIGENHPPQASFVYTPENPNSRDVVTFTSTSTDDDGIQYIDWYIGGDHFSDPVIQDKVCGPSVHVQLVVSDYASQSTSLEIDIPMGGTNRPSVPAGSDLGAADVAACPGDTLVLEAGDYPGGATIWQTDLEGAGQGLTRIVGAGADGWVLHLGAYEGNPLSLSSLTLSGGTEVIDSDGRRNGGGIEILGKGQTTLSNVEISDNLGPAGVSTYNTRGLLVKNSQFHDNAWFGLVVNVDGAEIRNTAFFRNGAAIDVSEGGILVERCDLFDNYYGALSFNGASGSIISSRLFGNNAKGGGYAIISDYPALKVAGCLIAENYGGGLSLPNLTVLSSTIANNCGIGIAATEMSVHDSIVYGNVTDLESPLTDQSSNLIGVDPWFVGAGDFHLASGSPAIDQGDPAWLPSGSDLPVLDQDGDGDPRILAGASSTTPVLDIGWDEWRLGQPVTTVPTVTCNDGVGGDAGSSGNGGSAGTLGSATVAGTTFGGAGAEVGGAPIVGGAGASLGGAQHTGGHVASAGQGGTLASVAGSSSVAGASSDATGAVAGWAVSSGGDVGFSGSGGRADGSATGQDLAGAFGMAGRSSIGGSASSIAPGQSTSAAPSGGSGADANPDSGCSCRLVATRRSSNGLLAWCAAIVGLTRLRRRKVSGVAPPRGCNGG